MDKLGNAQGQMGVTKGGVDGRKQSRCSEREFSSLPAVVAL